MLSSQIGGNLTKAFSKGTTKSIARRPRFFEIRKRQFILHVPKLFYLIVSDFGMDYVWRTFWQGIILMYGWDVHAREGEIPWKHYHRWHFQEPITYERWIDTGRVLI
jgi:hypothetical protein